MPERGAPPKVPKLQRTALRAVSALSSPLLPDDYLELINPLWSTRELRGKVERIERETPSAATVVIRPGYEWPGHQPGQFVRIGVDVDGVRHWRAYSLTSDPEDPDGLISITVKNVDEGKVSPHLVNRLRPGAIVSLGGVEGSFLVPDPLPERMLFISAGSGITPIMSMLRNLDRAGDLRDAVHLHSAQTADEVIFGDRLRELARRNPGFSLHEQHTREAGRIGPQDLESLCPDWHERATFLSGPSEMLDAFEAHWEEHGLRDDLRMERFQPKLAADIEEGEGGTVVFKRSAVETACDGTTPILVAGEEEGLELDYGCREGICHTCVGQLLSGQVRDLRNGNVHGNQGENVRICIHAPQGPVEIDL